MSEQWDRRIKDGLDAQSKGQFGDAEAFFQAALEVAHKLPVAESFEISKELLREAGDPKVIELPDSRPVLVAMTLEYLAELHASHQRRTSAEEFFREVLELREKHLGPRHHKVAKTLFDLAGICLADQRMEESEAFHRRALEVARHALDEEDVASILHSLGTVHQLLGQHGVAVEDLRESLELRQRITETNPYDLLATQNLLAESLEESQQDVEAIELYREILRLKETTLGPQHVGLIGSLRRICSLHEKADEYEPARDLQQRILAIQESAFGEEHPSLAVTLRDLARCLTELDDYPQVATCIEKMLAIQERKLGKDHAELREDMEFLQQVYEYLERDEDVRRVADRLARLR
jgi:hypothetical protein